MNCNKLIITKKNKNSSRKIKIIKSQNIKTKSNNHKKNMRKEGDKGLMKLIIINMRRPIIAK